VIGTRLGVTIIFELGLEFGVLHFCWAMTVAFFIIFSHMVYAQYRVKEICTILKA
jgi:hypothetical protein